MKLKQSQVWKQGDRYLHVVRVERLSVDYKDLPEPESKKGTHHHVTKKEFCRLTKGAMLLSAEGVPMTPISD